MLSNYLNTYEGKNEFCKLIKIHENILLDELIESFKNEDLKEKIISICTHFLRNNFSFNERFKFWNLIVSNEITKNIIMDSSLINYTYHKNILNSIFMTKDYISIQDIDKIYNLFCKLFQNSNHMKSMIDLIKNYINKYIIKTKTVYNSILEFPENINSESINLEKRTINITLLLIKLNNKYENDVLHKLCLKLIDYGLVNYIDEQYLREYELTQIKKLELENYMKKYYKKKLYKRIEMLRELSIVYLYKDFDFFFENTINDIIKTKKYFSNQTFISNYLVYYNIKKNTHYLQKNTIVLLRNILHHKKNFNSYLQEQALEILINIFSDKNQICNYNNQLLVNDIKINYNIWINNIFNIYYKIYNREIENKNFLNLFIKILDLNNTISSKNIKKINYFLITEIKELFPKIKLTFNYYMDYIGSELFDDVSFDNIKEVSKNKLNDLCIKLYYNIRILKKLNYSFNLFLTYENRNNFIETITDFIDFILLDEFFYYDFNLTKSKYCNIEKLSEYIENNNIDIVENFNLKYCFLNLFEKIFYELIEDNYDKITYIFSNRIIDFNKQKWLSISELFNKKILLKLFIKNVEKDLINEDDIEDSMLDPLTYSIICHPVYLPNQIFIDKYTIYRHLINTKKNPFTNQYLDEKILEEFNKTEEVLLKVQQFYKNLNNIIN